MENSIFQSQIVRVWTHSVRYCVAATRHPQLPSEECKDNTSKDPFSRCEICKKNLGFCLNWRWQDKVGLPHPEKIFVLGIACAWRKWTVRRPTPMTSWKPRSTRSTWNPTMTWHTWVTREHARGVVSLVLFGSCMKWAFRLTSLNSSSPFHLPLIPHQPQAVLATLQLPRG